MRGPRSFRYRLATRLSWRLERSPVERSDLTGLVGCAFTLAKDVTAVALGRFASGSKADHPRTAVATGVLARGGRVGAPGSQRDCGDVNGFAVAAALPVALDAGTRYMIVLRDKNGDTLDRETMVQALQAFSVVLRRQCGKARISQKRLKTTTRVLERKLPRPAKRAQVQSRMQVNQMAFICVLPTSLPPPHQPVPSLRDSQAASLPCAPPVETRSGFGSGSGVGSRLRRAWRLRLARAAARAPAQTVAWALVPAAARAWAWALVAAAACVLPPATPNPPPARPSPSAHPPPPESEGGPEAFRPSTSPSTPPRQEGSTYPAAAQAVGHPSPPNAAA